MTFSFAGSLASTVLRTTNTTTAIAQALRTSTITSTSEESSLAFSTDLLRSMSATTTVIAGAFGTEGTTPSGGSTMRYTPAGAAVIDAVRAAGESAGVFGSGPSIDTSLLTPGAVDIASEAAGTSGIAGVLAGTGSMYEGFRSEIESRITEGGPLDAVVTERTASRLRLTVERILTDPRELRARERGEPPIPPEEGEVYNGPESMRLRTDEKPAILAVIEEDIQTNGVPGQVTLIIKKLISERFRAIEYRIFKKSIFTDRSYDGGTLLAGTSGLATSLSPRYTEAAIEAGFRLPDILTYTDPDIEGGRVYAYKVKVVYDGDIDGAAEDREEAETMVSAIFGSDPSGPTGAGGSITSPVIKVFGTDGFGIITESVLTALGADGVSAGSTTSSGGSSGREGTGVPGFGGGSGLPGF